jgi:hypothetical protein
MNRKKANTPAADHASHAADPASGSTGLFDVNISYGNTHRYRSGYFSGLAHRFDELCEDLAFGHMWLSGMVAAAVILALANTISS